MYCYVVHSIMSSCSPYAKACHSVSLIIHCISEQFPSPCLLCFPSRMKLILATTLDTAHCGEPTSPLTLHLWPHPRGQRPLPPQSKCCHRGRRIRTRQQCRGRSCAGALRPSIATTMGWSWAWCVPLLPWIPMLCRKLYQNQNWFI